MMTKAQRFQRIKSSLTESQTQVIHFVGFRGKNKKTYPRFSTSKSRTTLQSL